MASKRNEQFELICNGTTKKHKNCKNIVGVTIDSKLSYNEDIGNIFKAANKKLNDLNSINETKSKGIISVFLRNVSV